MRLPIDLETGITQLDSKSSITDFAKKLKSKMNDAFGVAQQNLGKAHKIQKSAYDDMLDTIVIKWVTTFFTMTTEQGVEDV